MHVIYGLVALILSVGGAYVLQKGNLLVLFQPYEVLLILGAGISAFYVGNTPDTFRRALSIVRRCTRGPRFRGGEYRDLMLMMYQVFRTMRIHGSPSMEKHVDDPEDSKIFSRYPQITSQPEFELFSDYCRMIISGSDNAFEIEALLDGEIETLRNEDAAATQSLTVLGESFPALGIVAAVLGVIKAMGAVSEPPEILGGLIAAALVGTFLGVFLSYGVFTPLATLSKQIVEDEHCFLACMKAGILGHLRGAAPIVSVEHARKAIPSHHRPSFYEMEDAINGAPRS